MAKMQRGSLRNEYVHARITPAEKLLLYRLGAKQGGLSGALRHLIAQYASERTTSTNDKSASTSQGERALVTTN